MKLGVVRFITAGSVDDGKSTLIGRLLFDTKSILVDQLESLSKTRHARVAATDAGVDLALLTDGLEAEREQGITIDVAYRYFSTPKRKFIVADAPGHEQYTRNLVTGASQSDVAIVLVDATRVILSPHHEAELLAQTKRHSALVRLLGLRHVAFAVNKMDLLDFEQAPFGSIRKSIDSLAEKLGLPQPFVIPVSALLGENVVHNGSRMPWHQGPTLLEWLENLDLDHEDPLDRGDPDASLRLPIQYVMRQEGSAREDFRGYLGNIAYGTLREGQKVTFLPSQEQATVGEIYLASQDMQEKGGNRVGSASAGSPVAIRLLEDLDISRGDMVVAAEAWNREFQHPTLYGQLQADLCWLDSEPLSITRKYLLRHTTRSVFARVKSIDQVLDVHTLSQDTGKHALHANEIGRVSLILQHPIVADPFNQGRRTGCFILIDTATNHTVAAGMICDELGGNCNSEMP
jgi:sulfate adenylyltransferase subunit 1